MNIYSVIIYFSLRLYKWSSKAMHKIKLKNKIKKLLKVKGAIKLSTQQKREIKAFFKQYYSGKIDLSWHQYFMNCNGIYSEKYLPEDLYYLVLEPHLNRKEFYPSLADKNILEKLFPNANTPKTVVKNVNGSYFDDKGLISKAVAISRCQNFQRMIIKPTIETGGGKNVLLMEKIEGRIENDGVPIEEAMQQFAKDYIIQEVVEQHPLMKALNEASLNTFRVMTLLKGTEVTVLSAIVRIGREGSSTDNSTSGGISSGIEIDGKLKKVGIQLSTSLEFTHTDNGLSFEDVYLPFTSKVFETAQELHSTAPHFRMISWDLAVTPEEEVVLVEYNIFGQDINLPQLNNGPVFSALIEELREL